MCWLHRFLHFTGFWIICRTCAYPTRWPFPSRRSWSVNLFCQTTILTYSSRPGLRLTLVLLYLCSLGKNIKVQIPMKNWSENLWGIIFCFRKHYRSKNPFFKYQCGHLYSCVKFKLYLFQIGQNTGWSGDGSGPVSRRSRSRRLPAARTHHHHWGGRGSSSVLGNQLQE